MKMITTGDIKISVLIEEDVTAESTEAVFDEDTKERIKKAHEENKKAINGRRALRAIHRAFGLSEPRKGAGVSPEFGESGFHRRAWPFVVAPEADRASALARLDGMEDVLVSGVHLNSEQCRLTIFDFPDFPGNCAKVFNAIAQAGILVDMIVQNMTGAGTAELSFTLPKASMQQAVVITQQVVQLLDPACRVQADADIAVLYVLGVGMRSHTGVARTMFGALAQEQINIGMINTSEVCIGVAIQSDHGQRALQCLKAAFDLA